MTIIRGQRSTVWDANSQQGSATSAFCTFATNPKAGSTIIVTLQPGGATPTSVVDNGVVQSTFVADVSNTGAQGSFIYRANNITLPASGQYTVTVTTSVAHTIQIVATEYIGMKAGAPRATNTGAATSTAVTTNSVTGTTGALYIAHFSNADGANPATTTFNSGPTFSEFGQNDNGASFWPCASADAIIAAGGAQTVTWTTSSFAWVSTIATYDAGPEAVGQTPTAFHPGRGPTAQGRFFQRPLSTDFPPVAAVTAIADSTAILPQSFHPGRGPSNLARFFQRTMSTDMPTGVTVNAETTTGAGTAYDATVEVDVASDVATGTGTAYDAQAGVGGNADVATGTGTAFDATVEVDVNADVATATGTAYGATIAYDPGPGAFSQSFHPGRGPSNVGRFFQRPLSTETPSDRSANADVATGAGTAFDATVEVDVASDVATGTGTAYDAQAGVGANADVAAGTGAAYDATVVATTTDVGAFSQSFHPGRGPSNMGRFFQRPLSTDFVGFTPGIANADYAAGVGAAFDATVEVDVAGGVATGTGTAYDAQAGVGANADVATGVGIAYDAQPSVGGNADVASAGVGAAFDAIVALGIAVDVATGLGVAYDATVSTSIPDVPVGAFSQSFHPGRGTSNVGRFFQRRQSTDVLAAGSPADFRSGDGGLVLVGSDTSTSMASGSTSSTDLQTDSQATRFISGR